MRRRRLVPSVCAIALSLSLGACRGDADDGTADDGESAQAESGDPSGGQGATVSGVSGPGGLTSPALAEGTLLGKGATISPGQWVHTPRGTLAELSLQWGGTVRLNEDTEVGLPGGDHPDHIALRKGEVVVQPARDKGKSITVGAGDDRLEVLSGEVQARVSGDRRYYAVVHGHAKLQTGSQTIEMGAGESIETPLAEEKRDPKPEISLRPLDDTAWARSFDTAARMAADVPRGVGSLTARRAGSQTERQRLKLTDQRVTVNISGRIAHTEIEQAFFNETPAVLEGIYRFPLPSDGSISGLGLLVGNTWMTGEMVEKQRGRQIFQQIVDATIPRDPALLQWEQGNIFKLRVFPIPGRGERRIRLSYTQVLPVVGDSLRYRYPLGGSSSGATGTEIEHFALQVNIDRAELDDEQVAAIGTPMLELDRRVAGEVVELSTKRERFLPTFDLGVDIPTPKAAHRVHSETHLDRDGQAYFFLAMRPELELARTQGPVDYAFVLDRSHGTSPELWTVGRGIVEAMAEIMDGDDRLTVLACDSACDAAPGGLLAPSAASMSGVQSFLEAQDLAGSSDIGAMLTEASTALGASESNRERVVVYLGDGVPTSGELAADKLAKLVEAPLKGVKLQAVALGARSDLLTLGAITKLAGGDVLRADARDDLDGLVRELRIRAEVPMATDVSVELPSGMVQARQMQTSLRPGEDLVMVGKLTGPVTGDVRLRGRGPNGPVEASFPVDLQAQKSTDDRRNAHIPRTWAQMEIKHLTQTAGFAAKDQIVDLSQAYTVLSRHTALIVLENDAMYREFNVVRRAKSTDKWSGKLEDGADKAKEVRETEATTRLEAGLDEKTGKKDSVTTKSGGATASDRTTTESGLVGGSLPGDAGASRGPAPSQDPAPAKQPSATPAPVEEEIERSRDRRGGRGDDSGRFAPPPPPRGSSGSDFAEPEPDFADSEDEDAFGGESRPQRAKKSKKKRASKPRSPSRPEPKPKSGVALDDPLGGLGGGGSGRGVGNRRSRGWRGRPQPRVRIRDAANASPKALRQIAGLRGLVQADPSLRSAHSKLVRAAVRHGHSDALSFAQSWAESDPDHAPALLALADVLARAGDPLALRAYASATDVRPFVRKQHERLASAYERKGDLARSCSHRRAVVSIDPSRGGHHAQLVRCLERAGRPTMARDALLDGQGRATTDGKALATMAATLGSGAIGQPAARLHSFPELRATLTWSGESDLDIAIVDRRGRRLSTVRPEKVRVNEGRNSEVLTLARLGSGVFVEVTRYGERVTEAGLGPVTAQLQLRTPSGSRSFPITIGEGTVRVAKVAWSRRF